MKNKVFSYIRDRCSKIICRRAFVDIYRRLGFKYEHGIFAAEK